MQAFQQGYLSLDGRELPLFSHLIGLWKPWHGAVSCHDQLSLAAKKKGGLPATKTLTPMYSGDSSTAYCNCFFFLSLFALLLFTVFSAVTTSCSLNSCCCMLLYVTTPPCFLQALQAGPFYQQCSNLQMYTPTWYSAEASTTFTWNHKNLHIIHQVVMNSLQ